MQRDFISGHDGGRLHVAHAGSGPTVVLAHGYLVDHSSYAPVITLLLEKGYRVIAFDQRGHGASRVGSEGMSSSAMAQDYLSVLEHFQVEDARPEWIERTRQLLLQQNVRQSLPILRALLHENHYPRVHEVPLRTTILCGTHDRTCPRWHAETLARDIPGASLHMLTDIGHMVPFEAPDAVVAALGS